jgi:perosamine synthetase
LAEYLIPWAKPVFWGHEQSYVSDALGSTWISGGAYLDRLEHDVGAYCGVPHAFAVANGTAALHLAYLSIGLRPGDQVVVPGFCFLAAANVAILMGAVPVFAEVDPQTWCVTAEAIERVLTPRTRCVIPVHTYGNSCDMDPIIELCGRHQIPVIEDAAESFATRYKGRVTGSIGDIGSLSFQATKTITTGEGGMVLTAREDLVSSMRLYRSHGMSRTRYIHEVPGHNFRLTNMQAALGCAQFEHIDRIVQDRAQMKARYDSALAGLSGATMQFFAPEVDPVVWAVAVQLDPRAFPQGRDAVMAQLAEAGIESRPGFYPPTAMQSLYAAPEKLPICEDISSHIIVLPCFPSLTESEIATICRSLQALKR